MTWTLNIRMTDWTEIWHHNDDKERDSETHDEDVMEQRSG